MTLHDLKYPIGLYQANKTPNKKTLNRWISEIELFPEHLIHLVKDINMEALQWAYRPGGWTIKQVVHHCAAQKIYNINTATFVTKTSTFSI